MPAIGCPPQTRSANHRVMLAARHLKETAVFGFAIFASDSNRVSSVGTLIPFSDILLTRMSSHRGLSVCCRGGRSRQRGERVLRAGACRAASSAGAAATYSCCSCIR